ncbi:UNVERIFIED_CONTAM: hypothetical protein FKN15_016450 [Acipenser sinensis]
MQDYKYQNALQRKFTKQTARCPGEHGSMFSDAASLHMCSEVSWSTIEEAQSIETPTQTDSVLNCHYCCVHMQRDSFDVFLLSLGNGRRFNRALRSQPVQRCLVCPRGTGVA